MITSLAKIAIQEALAKIAIQEVAKPPNSFACSMGKSEIRLLRPLDTPVKGGGSLRNRAPMPGPPIFRSARDRGGPALPRH